MIDPRLHHELQRFWDEVSQGGPAAPGDLDPSLAETIRRLQAADAVPPPDPTRMRQIREDLMHAQTVPLSPDVGRPHVANGHAAPPWRAFLPALPVSRERRRWAVAQTTTALLLLLTLVAIYLAFRPGGHPAVIGPQDTPTATSAPTAIPAPSAPAVSTFLGGFARTGVNPGPGPRRVPTVRWSMEEEHPFWGAPAVVNGVVYSSGTGGSLVALDATTGRELWRFDTPSFSDASPTVVDGVVYAGFKDKKLRAFEAATGAVRWVFDAGEVIPDTPAVVDGVVYVGTGIESSPGTLFAVGAADGRERWRLPLDAAAFVSPAVAEGAVYVATGNPAGFTGAVYAVDAATGAQRWRVDNGYNFGGVAVVDGVLYATSTKGVIALDAVTGAQRWWFGPAEGEPYYAAPAVESGTVYAVSDLGTLYAIDAVAGTERWRADVPHGNLSPADPILADGTIYLSGDRQLYAIDAATGTERWRVDVPNDQISWAAPTVIDGAIYIGTGTWSGPGGLYALAEPDGTPAAFSMPQGNPAKTGVQPGPGPRGTPGVLWSVPISAEIGSVIVADGIAFVSNDGGGLVALDAATGEERWRTVVNSAGGTSSPTVVDGVVYIGGGFVHAYDAATGRERWRFAADAEVESSPTVVDGVVYVGSGVFSTGSVYALDAKTGEERWRFATDGAAYADVAVADGFVYAATGTGGYGPGQTLYALDAATGAERWHLEVGGVFGAPAVSDGVVYVGSVTGFYAVDSASGRERWRATGVPGTYAAPAVAGGLVYVAGYDGILKALDAATGEERWRFVTGGLKGSSPAVADDVVYLASLDQHVSAIDAVSGRLRWRFRTDYPIFNSSPAVLDGVVYVGASNTDSPGVVYALADVAGTPSAQ